MNAPPTVVEPVGDLGQEFVRDLGASTFLTVILNDPDTPQLLCDWDVPGVANPVSTCNAADDDEHITTLNLEYDLDLDGELVVAHVFDERSQTELTVKFLILVGLGEES